MRAVSQRFVDAMTRPGFDTVEGQKRKGVKKALGWAATIAANVITFGSAYAIARGIEFKAISRPQSTRVKDAKEFEGHAKEIEKLPHEKDDAISFYKGGLTEVFGNFAPCEVKYQDHNFNSVEAAFQGAKWIHVLEDSNVEEKTKLEIRKNLGMIQVADTAEEALKISRSLEKKFPKVFPKDWKGKEGENGLRDQVMWTLLCQKFSQEPYKSCLLSTGEAFLLEHRPQNGRDDYWSDGHDGRCGNRLGDMLMQLRDMLRKDQAGPLPKEAPAPKILEPDFGDRCGSSATKMNQAIKNNTLPYAPYNESPSFVKFLFSKPQQPQEEEGLPTEQAETERNNAISFISPESFSNELIAAETILKRYDELIENAKASDPVDNGKIEDLLKEKQTELDGLKGGLLDKFTRLKAFDKSHMNNTWWSVGVMKRVLEQADPNEWLQSLRIGFNKSLESDEESTF